MQAPSVDLSEETMFRAMYASDTTYDGLFYTCVTSTGIFCFPSCPARKPRQENVRFARTREEAVAGGFRPCKRCRPDLEAGRRTYEADLVAQVQALVDERLDQISIADVAGALSMNQHHLMRIFRRCAGMSIHEYILRRRIARAMDELRTGNVTVLEAGLRVGFDSPSALYVAFSRIVGMPPGEYRRTLEQRMPFAEVNRMFDRG